MKSQTSKKRVVEPQEPSKLRKKKEKDLIKPKRQFSDEKELQSSKKQPDTKGHQPTFEMPQERQQQRKDQQEYGRFSYHERQSRR